MNIDLIKSLGQSVKFADSIKSVFIQSMTNGLFVISSFDLDIFEDAYEVLTWEIKNGEVTVNGLHNLKPFYDLDEVFEYIYSYPNIMKIS